MARAIANVNIATDSFASWISITNQLADTFTIYALTANSAANGAQVTGNSALVGVFAANTIGVINGLRGGTVETPAHLPITSNTVFSGSQSNLSSNVFILNANTFVNSSVTHIVGGSLSVTSNANIVVANAFINATTMHVVGGTFEATSNIFVNNANTTINAAISYIKGGLANVTSNVSITSANVYVSATNATIASGQLTLSSNVNVTAANTTIVGSFTVNNVASLGNTTVTGFANVTTLNVTGNGTVNGALVVNNTAAVGNTTVTGTLTLNTNFVNQTVTNTNIGNANTSGVFTPVDVLVFSKPLEHRSGKITTSVVSLGGNVQTQDIVFAYSNTANDVVLTTYGTVSSPASANLGVFNAAINSTAVVIRFTQTSANSSVKMFVQYIK